MEAGIRDLDQEQKAGSKGSLLKVGAPRYCFERPALQLVHGHRFALK